MSFIYSFNPSFVYDIYDEFWSKIAKKFEVILSVSTYVYISHSHNSLLKVNPTKLNQMSSFTTLECKYVMKIFF